MNGDGTHVHVIDRVTGQPANFTWSPSGDLIAFDSGFSEEIDVFLERPDGTGRREIVNAEDPSFSPDGKRLALIHQDSIETTDLHGTDPLSLTDNLTPGFGFFENPRISPDGALVTFAAGKGFRSPSDIYVMAPGASTALKVTTSGKADSPDWGPAG